MIGRPNRLRFAAAGMASFALAAVSAHAAQELTVAPKTRMFEITMRYAFSTFPQEAQAYDYWFPMPLQDDRQWIYNRVIIAAYPVDFILLPDTGTELIHMKSGPRAQVPMSFKLTLDVERREDLRNDFRAPKAKLSAEEQKAAKEIAARWLQPEKLIPIDAAAKSRASAITAGKKTPLDKARAIYEHITDKMTLLAGPGQVPGAGGGSLAFVLRENKGDSLDLASGFVGLCRAAGIPARSIVGFQVPHGVPNGKISSYSGWAEFYLEGIGWVPVDLAEGIRNIGRRSYYFGALDENRVALSVGRDIVLAPPQSGPPLNWFTYPYWEADGERMPAPGVEVMFVSETSIQNRTGAMVPSPAKPYEPPAPTKTPG
ncbi:MAG TPA: transglutaminase-like domain-containing protein [Candidatus Polarisedimenticolia bacterium]|nr:transglutaminase-like domain-containing protein [Candidatus Polarisedimenticolia bacterium]